MAHCVYGILQHCAMDNSDNALGYAGLPVKSPALPTLVLAQLSTGCPQSSFPIYLHLSKTALSSKVKHFGGI